MFGGDGSSVYQLKQQARCLAALEGDTDHNKFLVATLELRAPNELHVLDFNEDTNEVRCERVYAHPHEAWCLASCPAPEHSELVMSVYSTGSVLRTALWRMEGLAEAGGDEDGAAQPAGAPPAAGQLTELLQLGAPAPLGEVRGLLWNAVLPEQAATLQRSRLTLWQLSHGGAASSAAEGASAPPPGDDGATFGCGRWDPHHAHSLGVGVGGDVVTLDMRSLKVAHRVAGAHAQAVRSIDYNPNKPYALLSAGDDYHLRVWDLRKPASPLLAQKAHSHWCAARATRRNSVRKSAQFCAQFGALMLTRSRPSQGDGGGVQPLPRPAPPLGVDRRRRQAVARRIDLVGASGRVRTRRRSGGRRRRRRRRPRQGVRIGTRLGLLGRLTRAQPAAHLSPRSSLPLLLSPQVRRARAVSLWSRVVGGRRVGLRLALARRQVHDQPRAARREVQDPLVARQMWS